MSVHSWLSATAPKTVTPKTPSPKPYPCVTKIPHPTDSRYPRPATPIYTQSSNLSPLTTCPAQPVTENSTVTMKAQFFYLVTFLFLPIFSTAAGPRGPLVGGWQPIKNVKDPHVKEIGEFAVSEYNKASSASLKFQNVVKGETQVVSGTNYRLVVVAKDGGVTKNYQAIVWEKPWENFKKLTSFTPVEA
ncbi:cysteine proteinase inhibitor 5 [Carya illinoinensis]|uniref:Cystatin domain-containing protein n=1 Tax=Carya illinoinensis TaxID=32201 RepID=A0A8T1PNC1_CARIL|nr:cysteine proteinase inhibitor 5 [Carya illinoinensis]KAG6641870.1 hypothetical protein CIPAW_09G103500 [Carya illinoinensis]KAG6695509.1 hypothetical protein I3842_09G101300 [Carya illinoinensis]